MAIFLINVLYNTDRSIKYPLVFMKAHIQKENTLYVVNGDFP